MRADKTDVSEGDIFTYTATFTLSADYVGKFTSAYYYTGRSPSSNADYVDFYDFQVESGSTVTDYEAVNNSEITFSTPIYGGSYNCLTGIVTSDKDSGGGDVTPTYQQTATANCLTLLGENNIWADTGNTTLQYIKLG